MSATAQQALHLRQTSAALSATTSFAACTWPGHCLGAACTTNDDCDNDWICVNSICSPCCESASAHISSTASPSPTSVPSQAAPDKGLDTASAIGIGVGIVAFLMLSVAAGFWIWVQRRKRSRASDAPKASLTGLGSYDTGSSTTVSDRKRLVGSTPAELPCVYQPAELSSVELAELEGSSRLDGKSMLKRKCPTPSPDQATTPRPARYHFEEYGISPDHNSPGQWTFAPMAKTPQSSASSLSKTPIICKPYQGPSAAQEETSDSS